MSGMAAACMHVGERWRPFRKCVSISYFTCLRLCLSVFCSAPVSTSITFMNVFWLRSEYNMGLTPVLLPKPDGTGVTSAYARK